jgi:sugar phosphate permease
LSQSPPLADQKRSQREILLALSGLIMGMFVAVLSGTVVSTSLPRIIADLGGDQAGYTWVITASLLATAVSTPIWGKLSDLLDRKLLLQLSLGIFVLATVIAGFARNTETLIALRVVQGIGVGGLTSLVFVAVALIISPRERGKYMGIVDGAPTSSSECPSPSPRSSSFSARCTCPAPTGRCASTTWVPHSSPWASHSYSSGSRWAAASSSGTR